jgi:hypothetical protein
MTRIKAGAAALALLLGAGPAFAASEMGLEHEQLASFEATWSISCARSPATARRTAATANASSVF